MSFVLIFILFVVGASLGSFVNVVVFRYNTGLSFLSGSSQCLSCGKKLEWYELLPIFSYIYLRGRCSVCKTKFSIIYFLIEVVSGIALVFLSLHYSVFSIHFLALATIYYLLAIIFLYDLRHKIIPSLPVYLFIVLSVLYSFFFLHSQLSTIIYSTILVPLPFFLIWLFSKGRLLGFGDIEIMAGLGALLGLPVGFSAVFVSFWIGTAYVIISLAFKRKLSMKSEVPFAPFLVLGAITAFVFGINLFGTGI